MLYWHTVSLTLSDMCLCNTFSVGAFGHQILVLVFLSVHKIVCLHFTFASLFLPTITSSVISVLQAQYISNTLIY